MTPKKVSADKQNSGYASASADRVTTELKRARRVSFDVALLPMERCSRAQGRKPYGITARYSAANDRTACAVPLFCGDEWSLVINIVWETRSYMCNSKRAKRVGMMHANDSLCVERVSLNPIRDLPEMLMEGT